MPDKIVAAGDMKFRVVPGWPGPDGQKFREVAGVAVDSQGLVYVFNRGTNPVMVFEPDGTLHDEWGSDLFTRAHNITIGPDDLVYAVDVAEHLVTKTTTSGEVLMTIGNKGQPSDTGITTDYRTITHGGAPFNQPTKAALNADGDIFVSDGYGNSRVHRFGSDGTLKLSWGEPGTADGEINLSHAVAVSPDGRVYVCDRENSRLQVFTQEGEHLDTWNEVSRPCDVFIGPDGLVYVAELGHKGGLSLAAPTDNPGIPSMSIWTVDHELVGKWGSDDIFEPGSFFSPHGIAIGPDNSLYVGEVTVSGDAGRGSFGEDYRSIQKFERVA
ncbi:MAG: peptidyl-alpha-hydroxyglycine alpha-amidating lyase family protein [Dehalococcoidia bacterium]